MDGKSKVLIVDDDDNAMETLIDLLDLSGFHSVSAKNGHEAIKVFENEKPDIVLLDTRLPFMNGYEVCEMIKEKSGGRVKIILYTAYAELVDIQRAKKAGADDFISKTEDFSNMLSLLKKFSNK